MVDFEAYLSFRQRAANNRNPIDRSDKSGRKMSVALLGPPPSTGAAFDMRSDTISNPTCSSTRIRRDCGDRSKEEVQDETVITNL
ncbi:hypothetical protein SULPSESMR1_01873 [Pseudosulfitobacter pseudonitzschiae]|uniref:Uncharacterized protein n=1 Tax=Pseudosulfitobacter pseudonitzschiae TaxID=1402135 RepID=A0A221K124_9RHOB|nr:hypothetical protein SULPSESMR1_01873 [Pseudosulfitobacter pseudonitzschiae]